MAKTHVARVKHLTLLRLEVMAAVTEAHLAKHMSRERDVSNVLNYSGGQVVLHWLQSTKPS